MDLYNARHFKKQVRKGLLYNKLKILYMEEVNKKYCVVAEDRTDKKRKALTKDLDYDTALRTKSFYNKELKWRYRYFKVAKWPYKQK